MLKIICLRSFPSKPRICQDDIVSPLPLNIVIIRKTFCMMKPLCYPPNVCRWHCHIHRACSRGNRHPQQHCTCHAVFWLEYQFKQDQGPGNWWTANHCPPQQNSKLRFTARLVRLPQPSLHSSAECGKKKKTYSSRSSPFYGDIDTALLRHVQVLGLPNAMFVKNPGSFPIHNHFQIKTTPLKYEQHPTIEEKNQRQRFGHVCRVNASRLPYRLFCSQLPTQWKVLWSAPK